MYGLFTIVEAARAAHGRRRATRQVPDAELALAHGNGGVLVQPGDGHPGIGRYAVTFDQAPRERCLVARPAALAAGSTQTKRKDGEQG